MISLLKETIFKHRLKKAGEQQIKSLIGAYGEYKTACLLKRRGMKLLQKNWRYKHGELDIIAKDKTCLVFIEVRTRNESALVSGVHTLSPNKKRTLKRTAAAYIRQLKRKPMHWRFDVAQANFNRKSQNLEIQYHESVSL